MTDKKELYEILFEEINGKMDLVLEGYGDIGRKFEEARIERQQIKEDMTCKIQFVADDLQETKVEMKETKVEMKGIKAELKETREELGEKIDKIGEIIEDHEVRIESLENNANVG